jgi:hypothetical protein
MNQSKLQPAPATSSEAACLQVGRSFAQSCKTVLRGYTHQLKVKSFNIQSYCTSESIKDLGSPYQASGSMSTVMEIAAAHNNVRLSQALGALHHTALELPYSVLDDLRRGIHCSRGGISRRRTTAEDTWKDSTWFGFARYRRRKVVDNLCRGLGPQFNFGRSCLNTATLV